MHSVIQRACQRSLKKLSSHSCLITSALTTCLIHISQPTELVTALKLLYWKLSTISSLLLTIEGFLSSLQDLSATFSTTDHKTLLSCLQSSYGICDLALAWFRPYDLVDRSQTVSVNGHLIFLIYTPEIWNPTRFSFGTVTVCLVYHYQVCVSCNWSPLFIAWKFCRWCRGTDVKSDARSPTNNLLLKIAFQIWNPGWPKTNSSSVKTEVLLAIPSRFKNHPSLPSSICINQWYQNFFFTSGPQPRSHPWFNTHLQTAHFKPVSYTHLTLPTNAEV